MWSNLYHDSVLWNMHQTLLEQHWAHKVVHIIVCRRMLCQITLPLRFRDRGTDPSCWTRFGAWNDLQTDKEEGQKKSSMSQVTVRQEKWSSHFFLQAIFPIFITQEILLPEVIGLWTLGLRDIYALFKRIPPKEGSPLKLKITYAQIQVPEYKPREPEFVSLTFFRALRSAGAMESM